MISALNEVVVELQRLLIDEAATTLILRRDMAPGRNNRRCPEEERTGLMYQMNSSNKRENG